MMHSLTTHCLYTQLKSKKSIGFPEKLCAAMAHITPGFSFAFLQECFIATLLQLARDDDEADLGTRPFDSDNDDLNDYPIWVAFKEQADILRRELGDGDNQQSQLLDWCRGNNKSHGISAEPTRYMRKPPPRSHNGQPSRSFFTMASTAYNLENLHVDDELLSELPYFSDKHSYVNTVSKLIA